MTKLRPALRRQAPGLAVEREYWDAGAEVVVGVDEVGRGAWAGPITVGAVAVPTERRLYKIRDSKMLRPGEREALHERIVTWATAWSVGHASSFECDELGMSEAQRLAAGRALAGLGLTPDVVLVDGKWDFVGGGRRIVGGDRLSLSVAAASIVAKVSRDRVMRDLAPEFPPYNFESNKGYPCPVHKAALQAWGPSVIHRRSWIYMEGLLWTGVRRHTRPSDQMAFDFS